MAVESDVIILYDLTLLVINLIKIIIMAYNSLVSVENIVPVGKLSAGSYNGFGFGNGIFNLIVPVSVFRQKIPFGRTLAKSPEMM